MRRKIKNKEKQWKNQNKSAAKVKGQKRENKAKKGKRREKKHKKN